jgi:aminoglycoside phosphotransferase (APT) family kinase protein
VEGGRGGQRYRRELVLRRHRDRESRWVLDDRDRAEREFALLRGLEARGFPVPHAYDWGRDGGGWVLMERLQGRPARGSKAACRAALYWLNRLHAITGESLLQAPLPHVTLVGVIARARSWGEEAGEEAVCQAAAELAASAAVPESPGHLLHGDPCPDRFRALRGRVVGWLGWAEGALGDPLWDLACFAREAPSDDRAPGLAPFVEDPRRRALLPLYTAALALRDWSAACLRQTRRMREGGAEHPEVLARAPFIDAARTRCLQALAALEYRQVNRP